VSDFLLVGLGNPGAKYERTRHNIGFMVVERFARRHQIPLTQQKFHGRYATGIACGERIVLLEPLTFMNASGKSVAAAASFYGIDPGSILVVHDDIDLDFGTLRVKVGGGHGGHNGLRDIFDRLGSKDFVRVRVGVGRPRHGDVTNHVLSPFGEDETARVDGVLDDAADAIETIFEDGPEAAQNEFNGR